MQHTSSNNTAKRNKTGGAKVQINNTAVEGIPGEPGEDTGGILPGQGKSHAINKLSKNPISKA